MIAINSLFRFKILEIIRLLFECVWLFGFVF
jgi:hypothetical protein